MPREIPIELDDHLQQSATTLTLLLRITPVTPGVSVYGVTELDRDVEYDAGAGAVIYRAAIGMVPPALIGYADLTTDLAQAEHLLPEYEIPELSEDAIRAGAYDFARFDVFLVNYRNLLQGHVHLRSGTIGQVSIRSDGLSFINELRDLAAKLKQSICSKDSITCRALFGSQPVGSSTPGPQVARDWCGFDATTLLEATTVDEVGAEVTGLIRAASYSGWTENHLVPGIVKALTGANAGRTFEISANTADGWITLAVEAGYPFAEGDEFEYRPNCNQQARDEAKGCKFFHGADWVNRFRGEPDMPMGDRDAMFSPGAGVGPGEGGTTFQPMDDEA